jgi:hypothetical protein
MTTRLFFYLIFFPWYRRYPDFDGPEIENRFKLSTYSDEHLVGPAKSIYQPRPS